MNSSLQQRWKAAQTKTTPAAGEPANAGAHLSNTMAAGPVANRFSTEVQPAAQGQHPLSTSGVNRMSIGGGAEAGASNQDLNKRLLELKGKLAALKKP